MTCTFTIVYMYRLFIVCLYFNFSSHDYFYKIMRWILIDNKLNEYLNAIRISIQFVLMFRTTRKVKFSLTQQASMRQHTRQKVYIVSGIHPTSSGWVVFFFIYVPNAQELKQGAFECHKCHLLLHSSCVLCLRGCHCVETDYPSKHIGQSVVTSMAQIDGLVNGLMRHQKNNL